MANKRILWVDDEIDTLAKPYSVFLSNLGYVLKTETNGQDAIDTFSSENFDLVILDEQMPGMTGLDVLPVLKRLKPEVPVVMMTKSEAVDTMTSALGKQIDDYLVKPVGVPQLTACLTKMMERQNIVRETTNKEFIQANMLLSSSIATSRNINDWNRLYESIVDWELRLEGDDTMNEMLLALKKEANINFCKFIDKEYATWIKNPASAPLLSHRILSERVLPLIKNKTKVALVVIDNFRLDQWKKIRPILAEDFDISTELYCGILPTATQYARNSIFSGLLPRDIKKLVPQYWVDDSESEERLNKYERELLTDYFERHKMSAVKQSYYKVGNNDSAEQYIKKFGGYANNDLNALVFCFVDNLSHSVTNNVMRDLLTDDAASRSVTLSWFKHSKFHETLSLMASKGYTIILTTDHGTIRVSDPVDIKGPRELNTNLRYKTGKNMDYEKALSKKTVIEAKKPEDIGLPTSSVASSFVFANNDGFFVYPNDRNEYVRVYKDSFQHGGISMEEMILPLATLKAKKNK